MFPQGSQIGGNLAYNLESALGDTTFSLANENFRHDAATDRLYHDVNTDRAELNAVPLFAEGRYRNWDWVRNNSSLFYHDPNGASFYLRLKQQEMGVRQPNWLCVFFPPVQGAISRYFRTFELVDLSLQVRPRWVANTRLIKYVEVDFASRSFGHTPVAFGALDVDNDWPRVATFVRAFPGLARPNDDVQAIGNMIDVMATIAVNATSRMELIQGDDVLIDVSYELFGWNDTNVLLSRSDRVHDIRNPQVAANLHDRFKFILLSILEFINTQAMEDRYSENGINNFYLRGVRLTSVLGGGGRLRGGGQFYNRPPTNVRVPKGGCMTHMSLNKSLLKILGEDTIISTDRPVNPYFFDNNCGIRELMNQTTTARVKAARGIYMQAAWMREAMRTIPPFVKLSPQDLFAICRANFPQWNLIIYILPSPYCQYSKSRRLVSTTRVVDANVPATRITHGTAHIAYMDGHYWQVHNVAKVMRVCWCPRCLRYHEKGKSRVTHWGPNGMDNRYDPMFPPCKVRDEMRWKKWILNTTSGLGSSENDLDEDGRILKTVYPLKYRWELTKFENVGLMDLETWRPPGLGGYHQVYAAGWIPHAKPDITTKDVKLYSLIDYVGRSAPCLPIGNCVIMTVMSELIEMIVVSGKYNHKNPYYLFFFYGSGFDVMFIINTLSTQMRLNPDSLLLHNGKPLSVSYLEGALIIRDLQLFTTGSLEKACKTYKVDDKLAKGKFDHDKLTSSEAIREAWPEISEYLSKDLTALNCVFISKFNDVFDTLELDMCTRVTASHLAFDYWNSTLSPEFRAHVILPATYDEYVDILKSYYGGRVLPGVQAWQSSEWESVKCRLEPSVEVSEDGRGVYISVEDSLIYLDVVSLYPSSMYFSESMSNAYFQGDRNMPFYFCGKPKTVYFGDSYDTQDRSLENLLLSYSVPSIYNHFPAMVCNRKICLDKGWDNENQGCIVCVDIEPNPLILVPILPHKTSKGMTAWDLQPHTKQYYVLDELLDALFYGYKVTRVHLALIYPKRLPLFDISVSKLSAMKIACSDDDPKRESIKLTANGTYGKLAQKIVETLQRIVYAEELPEVLNNPLLMSIEMLCKESTETTAQLADDGDGAPHYPIQAVLATFKAGECLPTKPTYLGSQVTAYSRIHMNFCLHSLGLLFNTTTINRQLFYTDTDSILTHHSNLTRFIKRKGEGLFGKQLGQLDDELKGGKVLRYVSLAPKTYAVVYIMPDDKCYTKIRCKGIPHTKDALPTFKSTLIDSKTLASVMTDGKLDSSKIPLKMTVFVVTYRSGIVDYMSSLTFDVFDGVSSGLVTDVVVYFTTMKRKMFGHNTNYEISGIQHCVMHRSLGSSSWWNGTSHDSVDPKHRTYLPNQERLGGISVPNNHVLSMSI